MTTYIAFNNQFENIFQADAHIAHKMINDMIDSFVNPKHPLYDESQEMINVIKQALNIDKIDNTISLLTWNNEEQKLSINYQGIANANPSWEYSEIIKPIQRLEENSVAKTLYIQSHKIDTELNFDVMREAIVTTVSQDLLQGADIQFGWQVRRYMLAKRDLDNDNETTEFISDMVWNSKFNDFINKLDIVCPTIRKPNVAADFQNHINGLLDNIKVDVFLTDAPKEAHPIQHHSDANRFVLENMDLRNLLEYQNLSVFDSYLGKEGTQLERMTARNEIFDRYFDETNQNGLNDSLLRLLSVNGIKMEVLADFESYQDWMKKDDDSRKLVDTIIAKHDDVMYLNNEVNIGYATRMSLGDMLMLNNIRNLTDKCKHFDDKAMEELSYLSKRQSLNQELKDIKIATKNVFESSDENKLQELQTQAFWSNIVPKSWLNDAVGIRSETVFADFVNANEIGATGRTAIIGDNVPPIRLADVVVLPTPEDQPDFFKNHYGIEPSTVDLKINIYHSIAYNDFPEGVPIPKTATELFINCSQDKVHALCEKNIQFILNTPQENHNPKPF